MRVRGGGRKRGGGEGREWNDNFNPKIPGRLLHKIVNIYNVNSKTSL